MTSFDFVLLAVVGISVAFALWRGFVREMLSLLSWVGAFFVARYFGASVALMLPKIITQADLRLGLGYGVVFLSSLLLFTLASILIAKLVRIAGLTLTDRVLGVVFGLARGVMIAVLLVLVGGLTVLPHQREWREALFSPPLEKIALSMRPLLPDELGARVKYD
jgi:membrane protein required for colicin V production